MPDPAGIQLRSNKQPTYISEFGCGGHFVVRRFEVRVALWDAWRLESERNFGMGFALWDGAPTLGRDSYLVEEGFYG